MKQKLLDDPPINSAQSLFSSIKSMMQNNVINTAQETGMGILYVENIDKMLTHIAIDLIGNSEILSDIWAQNDLQK